MTSELTGNALLTDAQRIARSITGDSWKARARQHRGGTGSH
jgi:hypothetical protein